MNARILRSVLLIPALLSEISTACDETCMVFPLPQFDNKVITEYVLWSDLNSQSYAACASKCKLYFRCKTAGYSPTTGECRGYAVGFATPEKTSADVSFGSKIYPMCRAANFIGSSCSSSSDCLVPNSICFDGQCTCDIGLKFSIDGLDKCIPNCLQLGSTFLEYDTKTVVGYNTKTLNGITVEACKQACIQESGFLCKGFEYEKPVSKCNLMDKTWLDVSSLWWNTNSDWALYTRNCLY